MHHKEEKSGAVSARVDNWMQIFDNEIFKDGCEKHQQRHAHAEELVAADQGETLDTDQSHVIALYL